MTGTPKTTKPLWSGDNGRITCADCAGSTAKASKMRRDLYGPMFRITLADVREWPTEELGPVKCEMCEAEASVLETVQS